MKTSMIYSIVKFNEIIKLSAAVNTWLASRQNRNCFRQESFRSVWVWAWACRTTYVPMADAGFDRTDGIEIEFGIGLKPAAAAAAAEAAAEHWFLERNRVKIFPFHCIRVVFKLKSLFCIYFSVMFSFTYLDVHISDFVPLLEMAGSIPLLGSGCIGGAVAYVHLKYKVVKQK